MEEQNRKTFGDDGAESSMGLNMMDMVGDMPLVSVLMWQQGALPMHPEDFVDELLAQAHGRA